MDKKGRLLSITPHMPGGITTPEQLRKIAAVAEKYEAKTLKVSAAQKISIIGLSKDNYLKALQDLGSKEEKFVFKSVKTIQICRGKEYCHFGMQNAVQLGLILNELYYGMELPYKLTIGVSGCGNSCAESWVKDIGLIGKKSGYQIVVGGNSGKNPRIAQTLFKSKTEEETLFIIKKLIDLYKNKGEEKERFSKFIDRITIEKIEKHLSENI